ncbi:TPA: hypothetical protein GDO54_018485 [Pyxicephalus adspersus]|uniref:Uncharacterized protein n=1 Tax=Pyxicephalus adspersus TaxID=30357 RepID=A0AAV2ZTN7_PYXAD|nr:TPA: hypothetical protein GDO54_018485 [Pyxicephalus adspersus]
MHFIDAYTLLIPSKENVFTPRWLFATRKPEYIILFSFLNYYPYFLIPTLYHRLPLWGIIQIVNGMCSLTVVFYSNRINNRKYRSILEINTLLLNISKCC